MSELDGSWDSTLTLLSRARDGDPQALDDLFRRYLPGIRKWASGRLPRWAREMSDTSDLVQDVLLKTFKKIDAFEHRGEGAFRAYLRQAVMNGIRDEVRRANRRPEITALDETFVASGFSPLEMTVGVENLARYEDALQRLAQTDRELIIARIEMGLNYSDLALATGKPTAEAARKAVGRALVRLSEELGDGSGQAS